MKRKLLRLNNDDRRINPLEIGEVRESLLDILGRSNEIACFRELLPHEGYNLNHVYHVYRSTIIMTEFYRQPSWAFTGIGIIISPYTRSMERIVEEMMSLSPKLEDQAKIYKEEWLKQSHEMGSNRGKESS